MTRATEPLDFGHDRALQGIARIRTRDTPGDAAGGRGRSQGRCARLADDSGLVPDDLDLGALYLLEDDLGDLLAAPDVDQLGALAGGDVPVPLVLLLGGSFALA